MTQDTIFALATAPGRGAIAVLRLSGPAVAPTLKALGAGGLKPRLAAVRELNHDGVPIDQALSFGSSHPIPIRARTLPSFICTAAVRWSRRLVAP